MTDHHTPDDHSAGGNERPRRDPPGGRERRFVIENAEPVINLRSPQFLVTGCRFLPCYMFDGPAGALTFADGYDCPIAQLSAQGEIKYLHPLSPLPDAPYYYLYLPWERPQDEPITFELVMVATYNNRLAPEVIRRWHLSEHGRLHPMIWGQNWTWP